MRGQTFCCLLSSSNLHQESGITTYIELNQLYTGLLVRDFAEIHVS